MGSLVYWDTHSKNCVMEAYTLNGSALRLGMQTHYLTHTWTYWKTAKQYFSTVVTQKPLYICIFLFNQFYYAIKSKVQVQWWILIHTHSASFLTTWAYENYKIHVYSITKNILTPAWALVSKMLLFLSWYNVVKNKLTAAQ